LNIFAVFVAIRVAGFAAVCLVYVTNVVILMLQWVPARVDVCWRGCVEVHDELIHRTVPRVFL